MTGEIGKGGIRLREVAGGGGLRLALREAGPEDAPAILLLHGWSQHSLVWLRQLEGPLARRFRLVALDLRGHGASEKPVAAEAYDRGEPWAADIAALIAGLGLRRPVAVGWSMGGWVLGDYLRRHGDGALGGLVLVGATPRIGARADPALMARRKADVRAEGMYGTDQRAEIEAAIAFARAMTAAPLSKRDMAFLVGLMMHCPPPVRRAARLRDEDWRAAFAAVAVPAMIVQGGAERVCLPEMAAELAEAMPAAEFHTIPGAGHLVFWERPGPFDTILAAFAARIHGLPD
jgi:pimeloyl-ACP methyl ester carboxylesterase